MWPTDYHHNYSFRQQPLESPSYYQLLLCLHFLYAAAKTCPFYFYNTCQNDLCLTALTLVSACVVSSLDHRKYLLMGFFVSNSVFSFYSLNSYRYYHITPKTFIALQSTHQDIIIPQLGSESFLKLTLCQTT